MKIQWTMLIALIFALFVAIFAVFNVDPVPVSYVFGEASIPLILVIIGSALLGGLIVGMFGIIQQYKLQHQIKGLKKELAEREKAHVEANASAIATTFQVEADDPISLSDDAETEDAKTSEADVAIEDEKKSTDT